MRIITGIQPTGILTLGNYLGSIKNFKKEITKAEEAYIFLADLHALTVNPNPEVLKQNIKNLSALYIAMDMDKIANIFMQSSIHEHSELGWILQCFTKNGELDRMTQYKDKSQKNLSISTALYTYPTLMAADILLYNADYVPVGEDQKQHLELTRDIAQRFNSFYNKEVFKIPEPLIQKQGAKIYSLTDPAKKMSKSDENPKSFISILDDEKTIIKKVKSATTDSLSKVKYDPENQPGVSNLLSIYAEIKNIPIKESEKYFENENYGFLKTEVANAIIEELKPIQEKYYEILKDEKLISDVLIKGQKEAQKIASESIKNIKDEVGLYLI